MAGVAVLLWYGSGWWLFAIRFQAPINAKRGNVLANVPGNETLLVAIYKKKKNTHRRWHQSDAGTTFFAGTATVF